MKSLILGQGAILFGCIYLSSGRNKTSVYMHRKLFVQTPFKVTRTAGTVHYYHRPASKQGNLPSIAFAKGLIM